MHPRLGKPFQTDRHLFEVKWDGVRCLAFIGGGYRLAKP
jgi:ATP-dependent DNA ligase